MEPIQKPSVKPTAAFKPLLSAIKASSATPAPPITTGHTHKPAEVIIENDTNSISTITVICSCGEKTILQLSHQ